MILLRECVNSERVPTSTIEGRYPMLTRQRDAILITVTYTITSLLCLAHIMPSYWIRRLSTRPKNEHVHFSSYSRIEAESQSNRNCSSRFTRDVGRWDGVESV